MKRKVKKGLLRNYIITYVSITILTFVSASILLLFFASNNLTKVMNGVTENSLDTFVDDLVEKIEIFGNISAEISFEKDFGVDVILENNSVKLLEVLEIFSSYSRNLPFDSEFFLKYSESDKILLSSGYLSYFSVYKQSEWSQEDKILIENTVENSTDSNVIKLSNNDYLFVFNCQISKYSINPTDANLCFIIPESKLQQYAQDNYGIESQELSIIFGENVFYSGDIVLPSETLYAVDDNDSVLLYLPISSTENYFQEFLGEVILYFMVPLLVLMLLISCLLAYKNYKPIKKIVSQYSSSLLENNGEIALIDNILTQNSRLIKEQEILIVRKLLSLIISGDSSADVCNLLKEYNLEIDEMHYYFISAVTIDEIPINNNFDNIIEEIDYISSGNSSLYFIRKSKNGKLIFFVTFDDIDQKVFLLKKVNDIFSSNGLSCTLNNGNTYSELSFMQTSFYEATYGGAEVENSSLSNEQIDIVSIAKNYIKNGDYENAISIFLKGEKIEQFETLPSLVQRYIVADISVNLTRLYNAFGISLKNRTVAVLLCATDYKTIVEQVTLIVDNCKIIEPTSENKEISEKMKSILKYIDENVLNNDMSLSSMSEYFNSHPNTISLLFKKELKMSYKDYVMHLRIERAKTLLVENEYSVSQICEMVGYANPSHFVKVFKENTGVTPNIYRKSIVND